MTDNLTEALRGLQEQIDAVVTALAQVGEAPDAALLQGAGALDSLPLDQVSVGEAPDAALLQGPPILLVSEAAELLRCDEATVYRMAKRRQLPSIRVGESSRGVRIPRAAVLEWIQRQTSQPAARPAPERRLRTVGGV